MDLLWAIGDIHGCARQLSLLLKKIKTTGGGKSIFLGDMIDRGPDSKEVVEIVKYQVDNNGALALLGNHENFALDYYSKAKQDRYYSNSMWLHPSNGGQQTRNSFGRDIPEKVLSWFKKLPVELIVEDYYFCHAPYTKTESKHDKIWKYVNFNREHKVSHPQFYGFCGHIHRLQEGLLSPRIYNGYAFIDTGCGCAKGAPLTAVEVHTKQIIQVYDEE